MNKWAWKRKIEREKEKHTTQGADAAAESNKATVEEDVRSRRQNNKKGEHRAGESHTARQPTCHARPSSHNARTRRQPLRTSTTTKRRRQTTKQEKYAEEGGRGGWGWMDAGGGDVVFTWHAFRCGVRRAQPVSKAKIQSSSHNTHSHKHTLAHLGPEAEGRGRGKRRTAS